jgi:hypothetical protein
VRERDRVSECERERGRERDRDRDTEMGPSRYGVLSDIGCRAYLVRDSADPDGPASALFGEEFYRLVHRFSSILLPSPFHFFSTIFFHRFQSVRHLCAHQHASVCVTRMRQYVRRSIERAELYGCVMQLRLTCTHALALSCRVLVELKASYARYTAAC